MSNPRDVPQPQEQGSEQPDSESPTGDPLPPSGPEARSNEVGSDEARSNEAGSDEAGSSQPGSNAMPSNAAGSSQPGSNAMPSNAAGSSQTESNATPSNAESNTTLSNEAGSDETRSGESGWTQPRRHQAPAGHQLPGHQPAQDHRGPGRGHQAPPPGYRPPGGFPVPGQQHGAPHDEARKEPHDEAHRNDAQSSGQYWQPNQPGRAGRFPFEIPADRPRNFNDVMPLGGFGGIFNVIGLPTELKVSYWIWVVGGLLGLLGGVIGLFGALVLIAIVPAVALLVFLLVVVSLVLSAAQIVLAMKMKEGREWARLALTIIAGVSLLQSIISSSMVGGQGANWFGFITGLVATVLMWVPNSQSWFAAVRGRY